jgi:hypothetical protein
MTSLPYEAFKWLDITMSGITTFLGFYAGLTMDKNRRKGFVLIGVSIGWVILNGIVWFKAMELMP